MFRRRRQRRAYKEGIQAATAEVEEVVADFNRWSHDEMTAFRKSIADLPAHPPSCPTCGTEMVKRRAKRGWNRGGYFWGCRAYPRCRGTRDFVRAR